MYGYTDRIDESMEGCLNGWKVGWFNGWMVLRMNGSMVSILETIPAWSRLDKRSRD
jgi:hypothetical protein